MAVMTFWFSGDEVDIGIYCYLTAEILTKVLQKCPLSAKYMNFVQTAEFD